MLLWDSTPSERDGPLAQQHGHTHALFNPGPNTRLVNALLTAGPFCMQMAGHKVSFLRDNGPGLERDGPRGVTRIPQPWRGKLVRALSGRRLHSQLARTDKWGPTDQSKHSETTQLKLLPGQRYANYAPPISTVFVIHSP
ncbi:hypothetical protein SKAU_G00231610 [Synaphobranchus kaupii]|uniref:Uncharacterized protein n=1 Tax=Synaphobranchus kaupii TaxID=118154 RepID=A0A9Q1ISE8_SYNKA|nr:hypothetical protein SKAU_G00231610 [Synaphobranchus kaupii]